MKRKEYYFRSTISKCFISLVLLLVKLEPIHPYFKLEPWVMVITSLLKKKRYSMRQAKSETHIQQKRNFFFR